MQQGKNVLGLKVVGHDPGAALISGNRVVAISEERLNRNKYSTGKFPVLSISYCLDTMGLKPGDIDLIVMDTVGENDEADVLALFRKNQGLPFAKAEVQVINHHLAHAASAFFCSPFNEAAIMVVDGVGSRVRTHLGTFAETETLFRGEKLEIQELQKTLHPFYHADLTETYGIGKLYTFITRRILSFGLYNEGKTMGLASYGNARNIFKNIPKDRWMKELNGHYLCNPKIRYPGDGIFTRRRIVRHPRKVLVSLFVEARRSVGETLKKQIARWGGQETRPVFESVYLPFSPRPKELPLPEQKCLSSSYREKILPPQDLLQGGDLLAQPARLSCLPSVTVDSKRKYRGATWRGPRSQ